MDPMAFCPTSNINIYRERLDQLDTHPTLDLPVELFALIFQNLVGDTSTLYSLTLTSRTTHGEAEKLLYRCMNRYNWRTQIGFLKKITCTPRYALLVQVIHVLPRPFQWDPDELRRSLAIALRHTFNLKQLRDGCFQDSLRPLLMPQLPVFRLTSFSFHDASGITQFEALLQFLILQPGLLGLSIRSEPNVITFPQIIGIINPCSAHITPKLQFLRGNLAMFVVFLPSRNVTVLDWEPTSKYEDGKALWEPIFSLHVQPSLGKLKYLCLRQYGYSRERPPLGEISQHLHSLEYIDLPGFRESEVRYLNLIPTLLGVAITGISSNTMQPDFDDTKFVDIVFKKCSHMKIIVIEVRSCYQMLGCKEFQIWKLHNWIALKVPPIKLVSISELTMHNIFELLSF